MEKEKNGKLASVLQKGKEIVLPICAKGKALAMQGYAKANGLMDKVSFLKDPIRKKCVWGALVALLAVMVFRSGINSGGVPNTPGGVAVAYLRALTSGKILEACKYDSAPNNFYFAYNYKYSDDPSQRKREKADAKNALNRMQKHYLDMGLKGCSIKVKNVTSGSADYEKFVVLQVKHKGEKFNPVVSLHKIDGSWKVVLWTLERGNENL